MSFLVEDRHRPEERVIKKRVNYKAGKIVKQKRGLFIKGRTEVVI